MKKTILLALSLFVVLFSTITATAQDLIHRKNGKTIEAKIIEVGDAEVKYKLFTQPDGVTFVMDASLIKKIVLANGTVHKFEEGGSIDNKEYYEGQNRSAYKVSFLGFIMGYTTLGYERNLKPGASVEAKLSIIGAGRSESLGTFGGVARKTEQRGIALGLGYKFTHKPDYYAARQRYAHLLKGGYIRPEINFGTYGENTYRYTGSATNNTPERQQTTYACLMICAGKQWVFENKFAIDFYYGIGTGFVTRSQTTTSTNIYTESFNTTRYGNNILSNNLAINMGLNIAILGK